MVLLFVLVPAAQIPDAIRFERHGRAQLACTMQLRVGTRGHRRKETIKGARPIYRPSPTPLSSSPKNKNKSALLPSWSNLPVH
jgi:hypothetical protein